MPQRADGAQGRAGESTGGLWEVLGVGSNMAKPELVV